VAYDGVRSYTALLNEKVELTRHAFFDAEMGSFNEHAVDADIQGARDIVAAVAPPADPEVLRGG
jgi:hypothetical protein